MNEELVATLKENLQNKKTNLEKELSAFATKDPDTKDDWDSKYPRIPQASAEEAADEVEEYENRISVEHTLELQLKAVNEALESIDKGTYGKCTKCQADISEERLKASPESILCQECK
tara:strand:- start:1068 stop:1421 length:354 start_codon:yes stop_codon:yes gene_type:complete